MGYVISFAQQKGGAGKTTVLAHLADAWARAGKSVAVADLDPQRSLTLWAAMQTNGRITARESAGWRAGSDIKELARAHDFVLVDCPGNASSLLEAALRESDLVIVPCQPSVFDAWASGAILEMAGREKTAARVLLNRVPPRGGTVDLVKAKLKELKAEVLKATLGNRVAFSTGIAGGTTSLGLARRSAANDEIGRLRKEVERVLKGI
jgi:chromosome partitioning protein